MIKCAVIAIFMAFMIGMGPHSRRHTVTVNEFFLGERSIGPWLFAFANSTAYFSAVFFVGYAGKIGFGLSVLWIAR